MTTALLILLLTNTLRVQPVVIDPYLTTQAQARAEYLCAHQQWSHDGFTENYQKTISKKYVYFGENLARNYRDTTKAFNGWITSPTHFANLINRHYSAIGVGYAPSCDLLVEYFGGKI